MKKIGVLFTAILLCLSGMAKDRGESWVQTENGKMDCIKVRLGYNKARVLLDTGEKNILAFNSISSFSINGKIYTKLRVYVDNKPTRQMAFMELIKTCGELSLYKLGFYELGSASPETITYRYYLFNGNKMHLELNEKTLANICLHFGLDYSVI